MIKVVPGQAPASWMSDSQFEARLGSDLNQALIPYDTGVTHMPLWHNGCSHEGYVLSWECNIIKDVVPYPGLGRPTERKLQLTGRNRVDIYLFYERPEDRELTVCLRFGPEPEEYFSPGRLGRFIRSAMRAVDMTPTDWWRPHYVSGHDTYGISWQLLQHFGVLSLVFTND